MVWTFRKRTNPPLPDGPARSLVVNFLYFYRKWETRNKTSGLIILHQANFLWQTRTLVLRVVWQRHLLASTHTIVVTRFYHQPPLQPPKRPFNVTNHHEFQKISPKLNRCPIKQTECCWHTSPYLTVLDVHLSLTYMQCWRANKQHKLHNTQATVSIQYTSFNNDR
jgi:hypothetical protein